MLESLLTGFLSNTKNKAPCLVKFYISILKHMKFGTCVFFICDNFECSIFFFEKFCN